MPSWWSGRLRRHLGVGVAVQPVQQAERVAVFGEEAAAQRQHGFAQRLAGQQRIEERVRPLRGRSEEHTSELQSLMRISYAVFCLKKKSNCTHHLQFPKFLWIS